MIISNKCTYFCDEIKHDKMSETFQSFIDTIKFFGKKKSLKKRDTSKSGYRVKYRTNCAWYMRYAVVGGHLPVYGYLFARAPLIYTHYRDRGEYFPTPLITKKAPRSRPRHTGKLCIIYLQIPFMRARGSVIAR